MVCPKRLLFKYYLDTFMEFLELICQILNTSFNMHEKPILCDLDDAVKAIRNKTVDVIFIENFMISRN